MLCWRGVFMIQIVRQDNSAISVEVDEDGIHHFLEMFYTIMEGNEFVLYVELDIGVVKTKKGGKIKSKRILCKKDDVNESAIAIEENDIVWKFEPDDIEMGIEMFTECSQQGYFYPSEFIQIHTPKNQKLDYVYCEYLQHTSFSV